MVLKNEDVGLKLFIILKSPYYKAFSGIASWMKMLSENWRVEHVNIYVYMYLDKYIYI